MSKANSRTGVRRKEEQVTLPWRRFTSRPLVPFIDEVIRHLNETAQPETFEALYRNPIPKDVQFFILKPDIVLDGRKRPNGDLAPCPMCTPNKYLTGSLIHIPSMECVAVIGHCCAEKESIAKAEREYKVRAKLKAEEDYLLACLPLINQRMEVLIGLRPYAKEAMRLYRRFRHRVPAVHSLLRSTKHQYRGHLMLSEIIRGEDESKVDYFGPSGFKGHGSGAVESREVNFGLLAGSIAVINDYKPVNDLETLIRQLESVQQPPTEEAVVEFICNVSNEQRRAAVAILRIVDAGVKRFVARLTEFFQFFTPENIATVNAFGTSPLNHLRFTAIYEQYRRPHVTIKQGQGVCLLAVEHLFDPNAFRWPDPEKG